MAGPDRRPAVRRVAALLAAGLAAVPALAAQAQQPGPEETGSKVVDIWKPRYMWGGEVTSPTTRARLQRHLTYVHSGVPPAYRGKTSPYQPTPELIARGREVYREHCARCHRMDGMGGGDSALGLAPSPALLRYMIERPAAADEYLLWTISDGGKPFGTDMPGFLGTLDREAVWAIVAFMRAGFPVIGAAPEPPKDPTKDSGDR